MFKALILVDNDFINYSIDLTDAAQRLAGEEELQLYGLGINLENQQIKGFDTLICVEEPAIQAKDSRVITDIVQQVHQKYDFDSIFILATDFGRMVAPRLAMRLKAGLVADITAIEVDQQSRKLIRPAFSGNMLASIICDTKPIMASVHPNVFQAEEVTKQPEIVNFSVGQMKPSTIEVLTVTENEKQQDIREAEVLVSAGAGFNEDLDQLTDLAHKLKGTVSASKPVVEQNRAPREIQVGQSGKTVSPSLYLALGIYGSMQHIEGLKNVKDLISVNIDQGAPLNYLANIIVVGDAVEFVAKLKHRLNC
ncbi:electron transfer flavoprotein subunit alpha/FixB family protein [Enterococcus sp. 669A]|uniref:Electron transfer flavoprotein subunit alpha/FixB family protein n=1 Tax=Candidatus Enterococcus moelleringii TaxID=2815325 RepID=A0ABS3LG61_9ENTE|nr:electron transfer flavoprotein subunit alpha/FixB family protein [Enterococcus sp. 669A]MBO1308621.1 electron transfer flavoprotein subunit alpha/FixB family protein [Enterococcus sp. 669A]